MHMCHHTYMSRGTVTKPKRAMFRYTPSTGCGYREADWSPQTRQLMPGLPSYRLEV